MAWNPNVPTVTNRVQDDLNAIRENFRHLDQLAERVDELQTVSELAPYVQAILDSRIVEMGTNSNGTYVRWENGLQVCWREAVLDATTSEITAYTLPATFTGACVGAHSLNSNLQAAAGRFSDLAGTVLGVSADRWLIYSFGSGINDDNAIVLFAIGKWK